MKKQGLIKQLIAGANDYLIPMGFEWHPDRSEFWADRNGYFDRICCNIWSHYERNIMLAFYRHLPEVENFRELYGPITDGTLGGKLSPTIATNPNSIQQKTFDLFSGGPNFVKELGHDANADDLLHQLKDLLSNVIFPVADEYSSIESLDQFLHHDIEELPKLGLIKFYSTKAWLLDYRWLFAKSLYIAKKLNNPASKIIYEVCHAHLAPHYKKGVEANDHLYEVFERVNNG